MRFGRQVAPTKFNILDSYVNAIDVPDGKRVTSVSVQGIGPEERIIVELEDLPIPEPTILASVTVTR